MEPFWLHHDPQGMAAEADIRRYASLRELLEQSCNKYRALPAFINMGVTLSFGELDRLSRDFGAYLPQVLKLAQDRRLVTGTGADFQNFRTLDQLQQFGHAGYQTGLRDGLAVADRQRPVR